MFLDRLFRPRPAQGVGRRLYVHVVEQSRVEALYGPYAAPDTTEGRFEIYTLHVVLVLDRLRGQGDRAGEISQALFDTYVQALDDALREMGVGDLSVGKKMRKLGEAFYGRVRSYEAAFADLPASEGLEALLERTVYAEAGAAHAPKLAQYVIEQRAALAAAPLERFFEGQIPWIAP